MCRLLHLLWLLLLPATCWAQLPHFIAHEGPESQKLQVLHQDSRGFIWAGTEQGLFRFDGQEWLGFFHADSLGTEAVTALGEGKDSTLWVGYEDGKIYFFKKGKLMPFEPEEGLPKVAITGIGEAPGGLLWMATYGEGLYYYLENRMYNINQDDGLADNDLYTMCFDMQGKVWVGSDGGLSRCDVIEGTKQLRNLGVQDGLPDYIVRSLDCDVAGNLWVGLYEGGFCRYDVQKDSFWVPEAVKNWNQGPVNALKCTGNQVWLGTGGHGLMRWEGTGLEQVEQASGKRINAIMADNQGNLWVADNTGGIYSSQVRFSFLGEELGNIQAIHHSRGGRLWFSTTEGLFSHWPGQKGFQRHPLPVEINIISLYEDANGFLWVGGFGAGVFRMNLETGAGKLLKESDGLVNGNVLSIAGNEREVWFATLGGASRVRLDEPLRFENFDRKDDPAISYLYYIFLDSQGRVWFASDGNGLCYLREGIFTHLPELEDLTVYSVTEDKTGGIWFSTAEEGLFRYREGKFTRLGQKQGLSEESISGLACDPAGNLILLHPSGLDVLDPATGHFSFYGEEVGIGPIEPDLNVLTQDERGNIWIGTRQGILRCGPPLGVVRKPQTRILNALAYLMPFSGKDPELAYDQNYLTFEYTGLWYQAPEAVRYQHRLLGFAPEWITSRDQQVTYPHLPPGRYTFEVRAAAGPFFGQAETESLRFVILPPLWQRWWFILMSVLALGGIGYGLLKLREQRLRKTERLEREKVEFQFETLKSQVNPHFLFNSFNTLITLIEEDSTGAVEYVEKLSDFFRTLLEYRSRTLISLREELALLQAYHFLQKKRYGDNLQLIINLSDEEQAGQIAPLSLQMLVENAVKHNVVSRSKPLVVEIRRKEDYLIVRNPLQPKRRPAPSTGLGLQNIASRYLLLGGRKVRIEKTEKEFIVGIPVVG